MINLDKNPIDFSLIEKGDIFTIPVLEKIIGKSSASDDFHWKVLALKEQIKKETGFSLKQENGNLLVLRDEQSSIYNDKRFHQHRRGMFESYKETQNVDVSQLTEVAKGEHERRVMTQSRYISALKKPKTIEMNVEQKQLSD